MHGVIRRRFWRRSLLLLTALPILAAARQEAPPDWPCAQAYVPELSEGAVWAGPPLEQAFREWRQTPELVRLVERIAPRRVPIEDAMSEVEAFARARPPDTRQHHLRLLFAGLFQTIDHERKEILAGIRRYSRRQAALARRIEERSEQLSKLPASAEPDLATRSAELQEQVYWDSRILEDRQRMLPYICDQPVVLEQRLFEIGRQISGALASAP
jgi:hypothetical protein